MKRLSVILLATAVLALPAVLIAAVLIATSLGSAQRVLADPGADVEITSVTKKVNEDGTMTETVVIENTGDADATGYRVTSQPYTGTKTEENRAEKQVKTGLTIKKGETLTLTFSFSKDFESYYVDVYSGAKDNEDFEDGELGDYEVEEVPDKEGDDIEEQSFFFPYPDPVAAIGGEHDFFIDIQAVSLPSGWSLISVTPSASFSLSEGQDQEIVSSFFVPGSATVGETGLVFMDIVQPDNNIRFHSQAGLIIVEPPVVGEVKLTQTVAGPAALQVSEDGAVTVTKTLHNNGPFGPVDVAISAAAVAPVGCTATADPLNATSATLDVSVPVDVIHNYTIHCTEQSEHTFTFDNDVTITTADVTDPDTTNNAASDSLTVIVTAKADVKLTQVVAGPSDLQVGEDGAVTVTKTLHNNGPFGPVVVLVPPSATAPVGCTATFVSGAGGVNLPVSAPVDVIHLYTIHCTDPSEHTFTFDNDAQVTDLHVVDPDTTNNSASSTLTVIVTANADIKITSFTCNQTGTTTITCDKVLHNNGTITVDVNVALSAISSAPAQCDVTPASKSTTVTLPPTTPVTVTEIFDLVGTGSSTITVDNDVTPSDPHVIDADGATASDSVAADCAVAEPHDVKLLKLVGPSKIKGGKTRQYIAQIKVNSPADEIPVAILVVDPISGCGTPTIDVEDPFDITPGEPDSLAIDIDDDGVLEVVAISRALNTDERPISAGDQVEAGTAHWLVRFPTCGPDVGTPFDYIVTADACHSGDPDPKGFFTDAFGADCPATQAADGGIDPNQANDAPVARLINDKLR